MNKFFMVLLILTFSISTFFIGKSAFGLEKFFSLDAKTKAFVNSWEIEEKDSSSFSIIASYYFFSNERKIEGKTEFMKPYFLNKVSATKAIEKLSSQDWEVFYRSSKLKENSLQKAFPFQDCIHAFLSLGVLIYFLFLKKWVAKLSV